MNKTIDNLSELKAFVDSVCVPNGATINILGEDLLAGNFDACHFVNPDGSEYDLHYTGPVEEGYRSPFEMVSSESDL